VVREFRWHTGATLRPLRDGERPVLFRDLGTVALARFLRGDLPRLAGPMTPLLYMRTIGYREPYVDHERTGRVVFLDLDAVAPWSSGIPEVYVARAGTPVDSQSVGFVPGDVALGIVDPRVRTRAALAELIPHHEERVADELARLDALNRALAASERLAEPLRRALQAGDLEARERMLRLGISEEDLCAAYHHLPRERRAFLDDALQSWRR
jgi:hypothetical protein